MFHSFVLSGWWIKCLHSRLAQILKRRPGKTDNVTDKVKRVVIYKGQGRCCRHSSQPRTKVERPVMLKGKGDSMWIRNMTRREEGLVESMQRLQGLTVSCVKTEPHQPCRTLEQCVKAETISKTSHNRLKAPITMRTWHTISPRQGEHFSSS